MFLFFKGIVKASIYIKEQLEAKKILESAFNYRKVYILIYIFK